MAETNCIAHPRKPTSYDVAGRTCSELARSLGVAQQTMNRYAARLAIAGYISFEGDPDDGRRANIVVNDPDAMRVFLDYIDAQRSLGDLLNDGKSLPAPTLRRSL